MKALRSILVWRTTTWLRSRSAWEMATDPPRLHNGSTNLGSTTGEYSWKKEQRKEERATEETKRPGSLIPEMPTEDKKMILEIRGDSKTIVVKGHSKLKTKERTIASLQNLQREWWGRGMDLRQRVADWAVHIFPEHNKEADSWAGKGIKGHEEVVDIAHVGWSQVTGLCGFWDGRCENGTCGAGIMIQIFTKALGWVPIHQKNVALCGVGILLMPIWAAAVRCWKMESVGGQKSECTLYDVVALRLSLAKMFFFGGMPCTRVDRYRPGLWLDGGLWLGCARHWEFVGMWVRSFVCPRRRFDCQTKIR